MGTIGLQYRQPALVYRTRPEPIRLFQNGLDRDTGALSLLRSKVRILEGVNVADETVATRGAIQPPAVQYCQKRLDDGLANTHADTLAISRAYVRRLPTMAPMNESSQGH